MIRIMRAWAVLMASGVFCSSAVAQDTPTERSAEEARQLFERGGLAMSRGEFADARDQFRASLALAANSGTAFNLAVALTRTGELVAADGFFEELLNGVHGELSRGQRREARTLREQNSAGIATLRVQLPPVEGLEVRVDGQDVGIEARVDPGAHIVAISSPRHQRSESAMTLERGETRVLRPTLELREGLSRGRLVVNGPDSGHLRIAGVAESMGTLDLELAPGRYELTLAGGGARERVREVVVEAGGTSRYEIEFPQARRGWLWALAGVLIVGAGAAAAIALTRGEQPPRSDRVYGTISTLRMP